MTESMVEAATAAWTCARCEMRVSFMADAASPGLPGTWAEENGALYCLTCRRDMAGDAGIAELPEDASNDERSKTRSRARVEFEIRRDPERQDNRIAKSCSTSIAAVRKTRERLGIKRPD